MSHVRIEKPRPHTSVIVMDRPERLNSMAFELVGPLHDAIEEVAADNDTWSVILTGTGRGFCSGADTQATEPPPNISGMTLTQIATRSMTILADQINGWSTQGVQLTKRMMWAGLETASLAASIELESHTQLFVRLTTKNFEEATRARKEGRRPTFED